MTTVILNDLRPLSIFRMRFTGSCVSEGGGRLEVSKLTLSPINDSCDVTSPIVAEGL